MYFLCILVLSLFGSDLTTCSNALSSSTFLAAMFVSANENPYEYIASFCLTTKMIYITLSPFQILQYIIYNPFVLIGLLNFFSANIKIYFDIKYLLRFFLYVIKKCVISILNKPFDPIARIQVLSTKLKRKIEDFSKMLVFVRYKGICEIKLPNLSPILHPFDPFIDALFRLYIPEMRLKVAMLYKRVNPVLDLKLKQLQKYDRSNLTDVNILGRISHWQHKMYTELKKSLYYDDFLKELSYELSRPYDFDSLDVDLSTAAGYPYPAGVLKRDVLSEEGSVAASVITNENYCNEYFSKHKWYTTGRAKMVPLNDSDSARLVCYPSTAVVLLTQKLGKPYTRFFIKAAQRFSAIGHSWTDFGSDKLAKHLNAQKGLAPIGKSFCSTDCSGFDQHVSSHFHTGRCNHYCSMIRDAVERNYLDSKYAEPYIHALTKAFNDAVNSNLIFPAGHLFQCSTGTKSGWPFTSIGNTEDHEVIFSIAMEDSCLSTYDVPHKLGGDDSIFTLPDNVESNSIIESYKTCGQEIKYVHRSRHLREVDFYSNFMIYDDDTAHYYHYRPSEETFARLLMPEELDIARRTQPDFVIAAERLLGHHIANWYNLDVRKQTLSMLVHLRDKYGVEEIEIKKVRDMFYKGYDLPRVMPTVPDYNYLRSLFGFDIKRNLIGYNEANAVYTKIPYFSLDLRENSDFLGVVAEDYVQEINLLKGARVSSESNFRIKKLARPFTLPFEFAGTAGGKLQQILTTYDVKPKTILDIGGHPGAMAASCFYRFKDATITVVSKKIEGDRLFMPKLPRHERVYLHEMDFNDYNLSGMYDLIYSDAYIPEVDTVSTIDQINDLRSRHVEMFSNFLHKVHKHTNMYIAKVQGLHPAFYDILYQGYVLFGGMDIIKPLYSYPWNTEVYVVFMRSSDQRRRRSIVFRALNSFRNRIARRLTSWATVRAECLNSLCEGREVIRNPLQTDDAFQQALRDHVLTLKPLY